jgi:hypothetical protein
MDVGTGQGRFQGEELDLEPYDGVGPRPTRTRSKNMKENHNYFPFRVS